MTIVAPLNVPSLLGEDASELYAKNQYNLLALMMKDNIIDDRLERRDSRQDRAHPCRQARDCRKPKPTPAAVPQEAAPNQPLKC